MSRVEMALFEVSAELHRKRMLSDGLPCACHLYNCVAIVTAYGGTENTQLAAALHETVSVLCWTPGHIETCWGAKVRSLVVKLTENSVQSWKERAQKVIDMAAKCCQGTAIVLMADKLDNCLMMCRERHRLPDYWAKKGVSHEDQVWFYTSLIKALQINNRIIDNAEYPELKTRELLHELEDAVAHLQCTC